MNNSNRKKEDLQEELRQIDFEMARYKTDQDRKDPKFKELKEREQKVLARLLTLRK